MDPRDFWPPLEPWGTLPPMMLPRGGEPPEGWAAWRARKEAEARAAGKIGPPSAPEPWTFGWLANTMLDFTPVGAAHALADAATAGVEASRARTWGEFLPAVGAGALAAVGMVPGAGPAARSRRAARILPPASTPSELLSVDHALRLRPITVTADSYGTAGILRDREFKSQFETHRSGGLLHPEYRRSFEARRLGFPLDTPDSQRPIYGALGLAPRMHAVRQYGDTTFVLRPEVKQRSTYTLGDSLDYDLKGKAWNRRGSDKLATDTRTAFPYIEAQVSRLQQPLLLGDVERVLFQRPDRKAYRALDRAGIPYDVMPDTVARAPGAPEWVNWWRQFGLTAPPIAFGGLWAMPPTTEGGV